MDDREIEIEVADNQAGGMNSFDIPGMPGGSVGMINLGEMLGKMGGGRTKTLRLTTKAARDTLDRRGGREAAGPGARDPRGDRAGGAERDRLPGRDRQDRQPLRIPRRRRRVPRGGAARPAAADRGHGGEHQIWAGEDRLYPVHRLGRVPCRQAVRPAARIAGPPADPGRTQPARQGRFEAHHAGARGQPDQAVQGADGDRAA